MKTAFTCFLCFFSLIALSQKSPVKFGNISPEEMTMRTCPIDSSAEAVVLVDYGEAYIQLLSNTSQMSFERHVRIKVIKTEGVDWANVSVPLYFSGSNEERISNLKAVSYNLENGKIVETKMSKEGVFKEKFNRNYNLHKFTIPNVKAGTVIEYSYRILSDFIFNFPNWKFQSSIPTMHSEYWAIIPDFFVFEKYMQGYVPVTNYEAPGKNLGTYQAKAHHWTVKNVPAFKKEPYMTTEDDYISKMNFALSHIAFPGQPVQEIMGSWEKLNGDLLKYEGFGDVIEKSGFLKKEVEPLVAGLSDPMEKIAAIHSFVKTNITWDGYKDFTAGNLRKIMDAKKGTSGDINLLLASMLDKAGLPVEMVLLSTRDHGFIRQSYPMQKQFNYTVCLVKAGDQELLLDATDRYLPYTVLPDRCLNGIGMVVTKLGPRWINIETKAKAKTTTSVSFTLSEDGALNGTLSRARDGYDALSSRKQFFAKGEEQYVKDFLGTRTWTVSSTKFENTDNLDKPMTEEHELTINDHAQLAGDVIYISPFLLDQIEKNPFSSETREYPVDFGPKIDRTYLFKLTVPEGFTVDESPQSKVFALPGNGARYIYNTAITGNVLSITSMLQINKNIFIQTEYPVLREFYNQVVAKQAEQIVLKRK